MDNIIIPDRIRPVLGIRQFILNTRQQTFYSPNRGGAQWFPNEVFEGRCVRTPNAGTFGQPYDQNHSTPSEFCSCGIHIGYDFPSLWYEGTVCMTQEGIAHNPFAEPLSARKPLSFAYADGGPRKCVYGLVAVMGDIIYAEKVMLASKAMIIALALPPKFIAPAHTHGTVKYHQRVVPHRGVLDVESLYELGDRYELPVENLQALSGHPDEIMAKLADKYNCDYVARNNILNELYALEQKEQEDV